MKEGRPTCLLPVRAGAQLNRASRTSTRPTSFRSSLAGEGALGKSSASPPDRRALIANAFTPYGPIKALGDGIHYSTLRNGYRSGSPLSARARAEELLPRVPRRHVTSKPSPLEA